MWQGFTCDAADDVKKRRRVLLCSARGVCEAAPESPKPALSKLHC